MPAADTEATPMRTRKVRGLVNTRYGTKRCSQMSCIDWELGGFWTQMNEVPGDTKHWVPAMSSHVSAII